MDNSRFLKIVIIILLLVNIGTLSFMWLHKPHDMPPPHGRGGPAGFLTHELNLTQEQQGQYEKMRDEHHRMVEDLRDKGRELHHRFFELLNSAETSLVRQLADSIASNQKQIDLVTFSHFQKVR